MPRAKRAKVLPTPAKFDSRICFAIAYFKTKREAAIYDEHVRNAGHTYNGGWFHGMSCGRDTQWDHVDPKLGQLYAVTT